MPTAQLPQHALFQRARTAAVTAAVRAAVVGAAVCGTAAVWAQAVPTESRIAQVTLYPGSATVERVAKVAAGTQKITFTCLPAALDVQSLAVAADATVRLGELAVLTE